MNEKEMLEQLHGLIEDRKAFITDDLEDSEIFRKDLVALEIIIENYKHLKQEIKSVNKGLRKVILKRKKWKDKYYKEKRDKKNLIKYLEKFISKTDYIVEQLDYSEVSKYDYEIIFKPESILPIKIETEVGGK